MHISFDFDYTLADSSEGTVACASYALSRLGRPPCGRETIKQTIGLSLERTFEVLTDDSSVRQGALFKRYFLEHAQEVMLSHINFYDYTSSLLKTLNQQGHYVSIVSTKLKERIQEALDRDDLSHLVQDVVGGGCVTRNKPDPEGLLRAMTTSAITPEETIYVGDSVSDGECAAKAGVAFVAVLTGKTSKSTLAEWNPVALFEHAGELTDLERLTP